MVVNAVFTPTFTKSNSVAAKYLINNWQFSLLSVVASSMGMTPTIQYSDKPTIVVGGKNLTPLYSSINGFGGSSRVPFESLSSLPIGNYYKTDVRLAKSLPITERVNAMIGFEAFNLLNSVIPYGGSPRVSQQYTTVNQKTFVTPTGQSFANIVALVPNTAYGALNQTQAPPDGTTARRGQAFVRINF
jgi:hypothetical protein